jgi:hypothetical protein
MAEEATKQEQPKAKRAATIDDGLQKPGDVIINQLLLNTVSSEFSLDLKPYMMEFHLYEDIFSPTLQGSVVIRDAINLIGKLPIIGDEILTVDIQTPWGDLAGENKSNLGSFDPLNKIQKSFSVYAVKNRKLNNDREQYYQLFFCSIEASTDNIIRLSQKYEGTTDEIAFKIFEDNISTPRIFTNKQAVDDTDDKTQLFIADTPHSSVITFVPPMWSPIQTINWLAKRCIGSEYKTPTFLFFETTKAFYLSSIEELVAYQLENNQIYSDYVYHPNIDSLDTTSSLSKGFATVEAMNFLTNLDIIQSQDLGHFASTVHSFDIVKKDYKSYYYDHGFNFNGTPENPTKHMESYKFVADSKGAGSFQYDETRKFNMIYPMNVLRSGDNRPFVSTVNPGVLDSTEDSIDLHPEQFVAQRNSSLMDITTMRLQLTVPGRTDIEVGRLIRFYYPSVGEKNVTDDSEAGIWDILISGIYMVTAIHHQITPFRHTMFIEIAKDSYAQPLYNVDDGEPETPETAPTAPAATPAPATTPTAIPAAKPTT